jgi:hypothetical protein
LLPRLVQRRKENRDQDRDNPYDNQQLDKGKTLLQTTETLTGT